MSLYDGSYQELREAAVSVLHRLSDLLNINTVYIAERVEDNVKIAHVYNHERELVEAGYQTSYEASYWQYIEANGREPFIIEDLQTNDLTKNMEVTKALQAGTLLGVPILVQNGENYGTLCALDDTSRSFTEEEMKLFSIMGKLLGYVIDVDIERYKTQTANVPLVPLGKGVVILPLTGSVSEKRAEAILERVLAYSTDESPDYMIIDVSGLIEREEAMTEKLLYVVNCLELVGTTAVIIGVRPDQALTLHASQMMSNEVIIKPSMPEALHSIGLKLDWK